MTSLTSSLEREAKLEAPEGFTLPDIGDAVAGALVVDLADARFDTVYYDTPDLRLARWGITVRCRVGEPSSAGGAVGDDAVGDDAGRWTVKLPHEGGTSSSVSRTEVVLDASSRTVPDEVAGLVRGLVRGALLAPVAVLRTVRRRHEVRVDGGVVAEIDDDDVSVVHAGEVSERFREIEVELAPGATPGVLDTIVDVLRAAGASTAASASKLARALGDAATAVPEVVVPSVARDASLGDVAHAAVADGVTRLLRHDPGVRLGGDPEDVHQARVATRRLRADLRTFRDAFDGDAAESLRTELRWFAGVLGGVRDADVLLLGLRAELALMSADETAAAMALVTRAERGRDEPARALAGALDDDRYLALLESLVRFAQRPDFAGAAGDAAAARLPVVVDRQWRRLRKAVDALPADPAPAALHEVRVKAKAVRYAADAASAASGKPMARVANRAKGLQETLGELNDAVGSEQWLRAAVPDLPPDAAFVTGLLVARQRLRQAEAKAAWRGQWSRLVQARRRARA
ncbi:MAG TPA: CYTH and CHAD domain-containing protein [Acidimicrobiales bacterium]